jgi:lysyl-tRNA synthetase class 2
VTNEPLWRPSASIETLRQRAQVISQIREFFQQRFYLEVDTPIMAHYGITDAYLANIKAVFRNKTYCLQTSPEYHMKRLLAAGSGPIFQMSRVFRDDELGRWHNPEFTLLEWYQLNIDHHALMNEMDLFLQTIIRSQPMIRKTYQQSFLEACQFDPLNASLDELKEALNKHSLGGVLKPEEQDKDQYLYLLMSHVVEPYLAHTDAPVAVYHFPTSQAVLAQISNGVAERFEVYYKGVELANGFHELLDMQAQKNRFEEDLSLRQALGFPLPELDPWLLDALEHGMPPCSGVALGVDRLLAIALQRSSLAEVMAFVLDRA